MATIERAVALGEAAGATRGREIVAVHVANGRAWTAISAAVVCRAVGLQAVEGTLDRTTRRTLRASGALAALARAYDRAYAVALRGTLAAAGADVAAVTDEAIEASIAARDYA